MDWDVLTFKDAGDVAPAPRVIEVGLNAFALTEHPGDALVTRDVAVCAGLVLLPEQAEHKAALLHAFSSGDFFAQGTERIRNHARKVWDSLAGALEDGARYHAIAFGGLDFKAFAAPDPVGLQQYFALHSKIAEKQKSEIYADLQKMNGIAASGSVNERAAARAQAGTLGRAWRQFAAPELDALREGAAGAITRNAAMYASRAINDTIFECAVNSGVLSNITDMRYAYARPLSAVVNSASRQVAIGPAEAFYEHSIMDQPALPGQRRVFGRHSQELHA